MNPKRSNAPNANETVWSAILAKNPKILREIDRNGFYDIESMEIKKYREPRLACKIDFKEQIPKPLRSERLSVLAIKNGVYRIARTKPFIDLPSINPLESANVERFEIPAYIKALDPNAISSEAKALDAALLSGMLDHVFKDQVSLVLRGYERSSPFDFALKNEGGGPSVPYSVDGVQIEVDGGYEGRHGIYLVEAKNKVNGNINLRQLLYPHKHYQQKFGVAKEVHTFVMLYDDVNQLYHFTRFQTRDAASAGAPYFVDESRLVSCALQDPVSVERDYWSELANISVDDAVVDASAPFPQADDFGKVFSAYLRLIDSAEITKFDLFSEYAITPRQFDYYGNALKWLGLANYDKRSRAYKLSNLGRSLWNLQSNKAVLFEIAKIVLTNDIFNECFHGGHHAVSNRARYRNGLRTPSMFKRRMSTVRSWIKYFETEFGPNFVQPIA